MGLSIISLTILITTSCIPKNKNNTTSIDSINQTKQDTLSDTITSKNNNDSLADSVITTCYITIFPEETDLLNKKYTDTDIDTFYYVEQMPQFPGGMESYNTFMKRIFKSNKNFSGKVYVEFIVNKEGRITNLSVLRSSDPTIEAEALRAFQKMPNWIPGKHNGKNVNVKMSIPINIR